MISDQTDTHNSLQRSDWIVLALILLYAAAGIWTLPAYGLTWDEGLGNLFFGERYFLFFSHPRESAIDFKADLPADHQSIDLGLSPYRRTPEQFPPFADTLSAASMHVLAFELGWMDPVDAFHLPKVLMVAVLLWLVYRFAARELGPIAGLTALLLLATFPRVWGDMHFNPKDIPEMVLFAATVLAYFAWMQRPTWPAAIGTGLLFGAALGTKANAVFIPPVLVLGLWPLRIDLKAWRSYIPTWQRGLRHHALMATTGAVFYVLSWPYLYIGNNPVRGITKYFQYILSQGGRTGDAGWTWGPSVQVLSTTPEVMLALLAVGLAFAAYQMFRGDPRRVNRLLLVWMLLPLVRASMPGMVNFDGIRHFLEFVPAAAMLGGIAGERLLRLPWPAPSLRHSAIALILLAFLGNTALIARDFSGREYIYYNAFIGGMAGARAAFGENEATDYWASSYRQGMAWLDAHAEAGAAVYVPVAGYLAELSGPLWLRPDIHVYDDKAVTEFSRAASPQYILLLYRPRFWDGFTRKAVQQLEPVYEISVQGVPILQIYRRK